MAKRPIAAQWHTADDLKRCPVCLRMFGPREGEFRSVYADRETDSEECARIWRGLKRKENHEKGVTAARTCATCRWEASGEWSEHCKPCGKGENWERGKKPRKFTFKPDIDAPFAA